MPNAECKMQNCGVPAAQIEIIGEADTIILHFAFRILHSNNQMGCNECSPFGYERVTQWAGWLPR